MRNNNVMTAQEPAHNYRATAKTYDGDFHGCDLSMGTKYRHQEIELINEIIENVMSTLGYGKVELTMTNDDEMVMIQIVGTNQ